MARFYSAPCALIVIGESRVTDCKWEVRFGRVATALIAAHPNGREPYGRMQDLSGRERAHRLAFPEAGMVDGVWHVSDRLDAKEVRTGEREDLKVSENRVRVDPHVGQPRLAAPSGEAVV